MTWTAIVEWPERGDVEEVDVQASSQREAERKVREELDQFYLPGWRIMSVGGRPPVIS